MELPLVRCPACKQEFPHPNHTAPAASDCPWCELNDAQRDCFETPQLSCSACGTICLPEECCPRQECENYRSL